MRCVVEFINLNKTVISPYVTDGMFVCGFEHVVNHALSGGVGRRDRVWLFVWFLTPSIRDSQHNMNA